MLCIFCVSITGCFGIQKEDHVAALVNGQKIYEKKVQTTLKASESKKEVMKLIQVGHNI